MKKIVVLLTLISIFLFSCENKDYAVSVSNNSTKTVRYVYTGKSDTLAVSETKTYIVPAYTESPRNYTDDNGIMSINMLYSSNGDGKYTFKDANYYYLEVTNNFSHEITISADNFIDNNGSKFLTIAANGNISNSNLKIFTNRPNFKATLSYPIIFDWKILGNTLYVNLR
jgi:hypothetical protein